MYYVKERYFQMEEALLFYAMASNRMRMVASWARVAPLRGERMVSERPVMRPVSMPQAMASLAHAEMVPASL